MLRYDVDRYGSMTRLRHVVAPMSRKACSCQHSSNVCGNPYWVPRHCQVIGYGVVPLFAVTCIQSSKMVIMYTEEVLHFITERQ